MTEIVTGHFHEAVTLGSLYLGNDSYAPQLSNARVWSDGSYLRVETTNRFALIRTQTPWQGPVFDVLVSASNLKLLKTHIKRGVRAARTDVVDLDVRDGTLAVESDGSQIVIEDERMSSGASWPQLDDFLRSAGSAQFDNASVTEWLALSPELVGKLKPLEQVSIRATRRNAGSLFVGKSKHFESEVKVFGIIMPRRLPVDPDIAGLIP